MYDLYKYIYYRYLHSACLLTFSTQLLLIFTDLQQYKIMYRMFKHMYLQMGYVDSIFLWPNII